MNILFLGYWNADDPLTSATILPHLKLLRGFKNVGSLVFANTQREEVSKGRVEEIEEIGIIYEPIFSKNIPINIFNKALDFWYFPRAIAKVIKKHNLELVIARAAPAGGLAYLVWSECKVPFVVESFEPHASYMLAAGIWKSVDPRYLYQLYLEKQQKKYAQALITVSHNYRKSLMEQGVSKDKLLTAPCAVDPERFYRDCFIKKSVREELKISESAVVGVYAGKFGGLYYEEEAFRLFKAAFDYFPTFYLLLLSPQDKSWVSKKIKQFEIPEESYAQMFLPHEEMNKYLNAADFAFAPIRKLPVSAFQSPVKTGEYWSVGLPVILTEGIGDEALFIEKEDLGFCFNPEETKYEKVFSQLNVLLNDTEKMGRISVKGNKIRNLKFTYFAYSSIVQQKKG